MTSRHVKSASALALMALVGCGGNVIDGDQHDAGSPRKLPMDASEAEDAAQVSHAADASMDAGPPADPYGVCSTDGWCFERPYPSAEALLAGARVSDALTVFVGARGRALQHDGVGLRGVDTGTDQDLRDVHAFAANDVWAVGTSSTFVHFDGESWSRYDFGVDGGALPSDGLNALWGASGSNAWAVGDAGALYHLQDGAWVRQTSVTGATLRDVWGLSATQAWAVGDQGTLLTYDGNQWVPSQLPGGGSLEAIAGTSASDLWAVGGEGRVLRWDGSTWTPVELTLPSVRLFDVLVRGANDVLVMGEHGALYHYDGTWHALSSGTEESLRAFVVDGDAFFAMGEHGTLMRWSGDERTTYSSGAHENFLDAFRAGDTTWLIGDAVLRSQGDALLGLDTGTARSLYGGCAVSDALAFAVGTAGTIVRWDGKALDTTNLESKRWLRAVWAASESSAWIVGERGTILGLFNGTKWVPTTPAPTNQDLYDVWGAALDDAWVVGDAGLLLHWDGAEWQAVPGPSDMALRTVWGSAGDDVWAAGAAGTIWHWNGKAWDVARDGGNDTFYGLWGTSAKDVYAVGSNGLVMHFDGKEWSAEATPTNVTLFGLVGDGHGKLRAAGADGVVLTKVIER